MESLSFSLLAYSTALAFAALAIIRNLQAKERRKRKEIETLFKMLEVARARMQPGTYSFYFQNGQLLEPKADLQSKDAREHQVIFRFFNEGALCEHPFDIPPKFRRGLLEQLPRAFIRKQA